MAAVLERLEVNNLAVIEKAELELGPGLNALTGETGAGKSLIVDALSLLLGAKADPGAIRPGAEAALVVAWISGRVYSRRVGARSTPRVEGEVVTLEELAREVSRHVALFAQHAAQTLTRPRAQREMLDTLLPADELEAYRRAHRRWRELGRRLQELREAARERARRLDTLRYQVEEIAAAGLSPDEEEELTLERDRLAHLEAIRERVGEALHLLTEEPDALGALGRASRLLESAAALTPELSPLAEELAQAEDAVSALARELEDRLQGLEADPERLAWVEERLDLYRRLKRKYGDTTEEVLAYRERAEAELSELEASDERLSELEEEHRRAEAEVRSRARRLSELRAGAKRRLEEAVGAELAELGMPGARLVVELSPLPEPGPHGAEEVRLLFSSSPELPPAPLEKAASGGELSRVLLALLLSSGVEAETVVLDEVDAGIGGETALALAERLARLARRHQVLVVTHLPQIAARAHHHFRVSKEGSRARVERLEGEDRVREIARMLSGSYREEALRHARALLAVAPGEDQGRDPEKDQ